jgi:Ni,Fe-hydrogenase I large subunit
MIHMRHDVQTIIEQVQAWQGVETAPHRFGGVEFNLGKVEVGHIHSNGMVDIPFTRKLREQLVAQGEAQPHHLLAESGWITFHLRTPQDVAQALRLYRLSYVQKGSRRGYDINVQDELTQLGFSNDVNALLHA